MNIPQPVDTDGLETIEFVAGKVSAYLGFDEIVIEQWDNLMSDKETAHIINRIRDLSGALTTIVHEAEHLLQALGEKIDIENAAN